MLCDRFIVAVLVTLGFETLSIRAGTSGVDRAKAVADFNSKVTKVDVLVTSMKLAPYGLNMHRNCCRGLILQYSWSGNAMMQAVGRLTRPGRVKRVIWRIIKAGGTFTNTKS